jgi:23S rRNA (cytosine1962-C5)-methyltransferase
MLSLFGHSGAATLAMAAAGAEVVHVDASRQAIGLARRNAAASGLADRPIRWICEDAATFVAREARRGSTYAGVVLDPPSWGHGPRGQPFAIDADLVPLVRATLGLVATAPAGPILLTCHSPGWSHDRLRDTLAAACSAAGRPTPVLEIGRLTCRDDTGRELDLGCFARCHPDTTQRCIP